MAVARVPLAYTDPQGTAWRVYDYRHQAPTPSVHATAGTLKRATSRVFVPASDGLRFSWALFSGEHADLSDARNPSA